MKFILEEKSGSAKRLKVFLVMIAAHSALVGVCLILLPPGILQYFGFDQSQERFFTVQGGVFHLVMCVAYVLGAMKLDESATLVHFSIIAKFMATIFLLSYFFLVEHIWTVLLSGAGDGIMGGAILWAYLDHARVEEDDLDLESE